MSEIIAELEQLLDLFREQVTVQPDHIAVTHGRESVTYRELAERSSNLAVYLRGLGVGSDECVGVFVEPSIELMVGIWGILFSGGAYLPLSPEYPDDRLRFMIEDSGARVIVTQDALRAKLAALAPAGMRIATAADAAAHARTARGAGATVAVDVRPEHLAYVIYTSGSTGRPKGVMIEHRSIVSQMLWLRAAYQLNRERVVLQKTPMSFDAAQWEILAPSCGSTVIMSDPGMHRDPERLIEAIVRHGVTTLQCVPTLLQALLDTEGFSRARSLSQIFCGGEALSRSLALQCTELLPWCELTNLYGPTECTINSSAFTVDRAALLAGASTISIGQPVANTRYYILDDRREPVQPGATGELFISGVQLARGYANRADLTAERFIANPFCTDPHHARLYRTGDLASWHADGVHFVGRVDNQVKLRGFRIELDEVRLAIETHEWVKHAGVIVKSDPRTGFQSLIAAVELNPKEAALMDQGNHGAHHQSKQDKVQLKAQLANVGCRSPEELAGKRAIDLPGEQPTPEQRRQVFARKTYRFFEGGRVSKADILRLLEPRRPLAAARADLTLAVLGHSLRYFGQYLSTERLLPKYGYASPGSLYATQMYFEIDELGDLVPGYYYYHPVHHQLVLIAEKTAARPRRIGIHFIGKRRAIEPVYKNNIREVLEIETGHMLGLFESVLPGHGLTIRDRGYLPAEKDKLACAPDDYYLGSFEMVPYVPPSDDDVEIYVQAHSARVADLPPGQYHYENGELAKVSDELILKRHVIAINQQVYERASFGITAISKTPRRWMSYIALGKKLQHLQQNALGLGFMSSGYSSETGNDLPSATRMQSILKACGRDGGPSYFFVGGRVSDDQIRSEGMKEDVVHMKGPAEMIKDDLAHFLPDYMIPNRVVVLDKLPLMANGKVDTGALAALEQVNVAAADRAFVAPRTPIEARLCELWKKEMKRDEVSVCDEFFALGGNSLIAVGLVNKINREFRSSLPLQILFERPTIEALALALDAADAQPASRLIRLHGTGGQPPVYCWPGLGGYPMNLRSLASRLDIDRPFYGVQAHGINDGETPYLTIKEMAAADVELIRERQPTGPYALWGYSFGARLAFEAAYQLERSGARVDHLYLIAPGSPKLAAQHESSSGAISGYRSKSFVTILFSVFAGAICGPDLDDCLAATHDEDSFVAFVSRRFKNLGPDLVRRIVRIVYLTYEFKYSFRELVERKVRAPITIFKARGDDYSFLETSRGYSARPPAIVDLEADHYSILREPTVEELVGAIRITHQDSNEEHTVPHVNIKYFPVPLSEQQQSELVASLTQVVQRAFGCDEGVISIALEPVAKEQWQERVYVPEIVNRKDLLRKVPNY
jgi:amino acid adenylation domain-containing protein